MATYAYQTPFSTPPTTNINEHYALPGYATTYTVQPSIDYKSSFVADVQDIREKTGLDDAKVDPRIKMDAPDVDGIPVGEGATVLSIQQPQRLTTDVQNAFGDGSARLADSNLIDDNNEIRMPFSSSPTDDQARSGGSPSSSPFPPPQFHSSPQPAISAMPSSPRPLPTYHLDARPITTTSPGSMGEVGVAISSNARAQAQHPTYITPPSSPKPMRTTMAVNSAATSPGASAPLVYSPSYPSSPAPLTPEPAKDFGSINPKNRADLVSSPVPYISQQQQYQQQIRASAPSPPFVPDNFQPQPQPYQNDYRGLAGLGNMNGLGGGGREICIECAMRDQDMADVDVTSPGVWDRESDVFYRDLCAAEELAQAQGHSSHSGEASREGEGEEDVIYSTTASASASAIWSKPGERPRSKGNRLTEANVKLWLTMNPREPQARQQTLDLYVKTQRSVLEAETYARARALVESRAIESKVRDAYDHIRRSTGEFGEDELQQTQARLRPSVSGKGHSPRRQTISGGTPVIVSPTGGTLPLGAPNGVYGHGRHQSAGTREATLLENGMIVEHVDVRREEKERRREEKRERKLEERRERERIRKAERASVAGFGPGMGSMGGLSDVQAMDSGSYTNASTSDRERDGGRPSSRYSVSQLSTRAMSVPMPISPPPSSAPSMRPANTRLQSQVSLADTQSIVSSISGGAGLNGGNMSARRSRFFAFRNWSEAWRSRESFATGATGMTGGVSGSMIDMHLALDNEKHRPMTADFGNNVPSVVVNGDAQQVPWPRRSVSDNLLSTPMDTVPDKSTKKRKGLAKLWKIVTGQGTHHKNRSKGSEATEQVREIQPIPRSEDDFPLAPPPPLSYLVNRSSAAPRERTLSASTSTARRVSTSSPSIASGGSTALPTPTSIRNLWQEQEAGMMDVSMASTGKPYDVLPVHVEESNNGYHQDSLVSAPDPDFARTVHPVASAPDMRQRVQDTPSFVHPNPPPPLPGATPAQIPGSPRPISVYSLHKSLPPLPGQEDQRDQQQNVLPAIVEPARPRTMYDMVSGPSMNQGEEDWDGTIRPPEPSFRREERRQSFGGMSSRPQVPANTRSLPLNGAHVKGPSDRLYNPYDEMGSPARGLGQMEAADRSSLTLPKRRSRFGLSSLLEKFSGSGHSSKEARRSLAPTPSSLSGYDGTASSRPSESDINLDGSFSGTEHGYNTGGGRPTSSRSRHGARASRMSVASRKAIEELVDQDPDFVAYRYPSADQNISLVAQ